MDDPTSAVLQQQHYDRLAEEYAAHYDDAWSTRYRDRFIHAPLFDGLDLAGRAVLDAMCGTGATTSALLARGARVTGLDASEACLRAFRERWPACATACASIVQSGLPARSFDAVFVIGGLHHLHPQVDDAIDEIHRLLKPGGTFGFFEPHAGSLPDVVRRRWYARDPLFAANEAAVDVDVLERRHARQFDVVRKAYGGNLAFHLVLNSMVFRIPVGWKRFYSTPLLGLEALLTKLQGRRLGCYVIAQWRARTA